MPATLSKSQILPGWIRSKQPRRSYAIACRGIVVVLQALVPGSLYIRTGDETQSYIEVTINAAAASHSATVQSGDVVATVRTLSADGENEGGEDDGEEIVKVEVLNDIEDGDEENVSPSEHSVASVEGPDACDAPDAVDDPEDSPISQSHAPADASLVATASSKSGAAPKGNDPQTPLPPQPKPKTEDFSPSTTFVPPTTAASSYPSVSTVPPSRGRLGVTRASSAPPALAAPHGQAPLAPPPLPERRPITRAPAFWRPMTRAPGPQLGPGETKPARRAQKHASSAPVSPSPATPSPRKRNASQMEDESSDGGHASGSRSRKRVKVKKESGSAGKATGSRKVKREDS
ncbi:hypothetical protein DFH07DRAFT_1057209 [Mycena maculata]|uniref:Uncharacterized protein n=1 Tax=Mycena maculata TaxID=230809 RepID=A0AAD7JX20_9AGAR|nr:hypothetical protein DFH07DRAFT_1057209 [Mycena maculata]